MKTNFKEYLSKKKAKQVATEMTRKSDRGRLRAYSCSFCEGYHVGHIRPNYEDRKEAERIDNENARLAAGYITSPSAMQIVQLTQAQYDALPVKIATTIYLIIQV